MNRYFSLLSFCLFSLSHWASGGGVFIYKQNSALSDASAVAARYYSYEKHGSSTRFTLDNGKQHSVTKFQPLVILPDPAPGKQDTVRAAELPQYEKKYSHYVDMYNQYPKSRKLVLPQVEAYKVMIQKLKAGKGYFRGSWVEDKTIEATLKKARESATKAYEQEILAKWLELKTGDKKSYKDVRVISKTDKEIKIVHSGGVATVHYQNMPDDKVVEIWKQTKKEKIKIEKDEKIWGKLEDEDEPAKKPKSPWDK